MLDKKALDEINKGANILRRDCVDKEDALEYVTELASDVNNDCRLNYHPDSPEWEGLLKTCQVAINNAFGD